MKGEQQNDVDVADLELFDGGPTLATNNQSTNQPYQSLYSLEADSRFII